MPEANLTDKAAALRALHRRGQPLILPNAWDAASARAFEAAGFPAVATSSAAVAATLGYDAQTSVERIAARLRDGEDPFGG
jgi:2-methylisocitrate lyase-like PEP mutase family enzyme